VPKIQSTQKLLKRLRRSASQLESPESGNPLGNWAADMEFLDRRPFVVLMNAATGVTLVLPGYAADLRKLHVLAADQLRVIFEVSRVAHNAAAMQELAAWKEAPTFVTNRNRSMAASLTRAKLDIWAALAYSDDQLVDIAIRHLTVPFTRKDLGRKMHYALDLLYEKLAPGTVPDGALVRSLMRR